MSENKIKISVTIDRELKENLQAKLADNGGKISTFFSTMAKYYLIDGRSKYPIWNPDIGYDVNQKAQLFIEMNHVLKVRELTGMLTTKILSIKTHETSVDSLEEDEINNLASLYDKEIEE